MPASRCSISARRSGAGATCSPCRTASPTFSWRIAAWSRATACCCARATIRCWPPPGSAILKAGGGRGHHDADAALPRDRVHRRQGADPVRDLPSCARRRYRGGGAVPAPIWNGCSISAAVTRTGSNPARRPSRRNSANVDTSAEDVRHHRLHLGLDGDAEGDDPLPPRPARRRRLLHRPMWWTSARATSSAAARRSPSYTGSASSWWMRRASAHRRCCWSGRRPNCCWRRSRRPGRTVCFSTPSGYKLMLDRAGNYDPVEPPGLRRRRRAAGAGGVQPLEGDHRPFR